MNKTEYFRLIFEGQVERLERNVQSIQKQIELFEDQLKQKHLDLKVEQELLSYASEELKKYV